MDERHLRITEVIQILSRIKDEHGDLLVTLKDPDTDGFFAVTPKMLTVQIGRVLLDCWYGDRDDPDASRLWQGYPAE